MRRDSSRPNLVLGFTYAAMLAVLGAACGAPAAVGPSPTTAAAVATAASIAATPTPAPATVRLGLPSVNLLNGPYLAGAELGIFKKYNLTIEVSVSGSSVTTQGGLLAGSLDVIAVSTDTAIIVNAKQPGAVAIIMSTINGSPYSMVVDPSIKRLQDLKGKIIVVSAPNIADGLIAQQMMESVGLKPGTDYSYLVSSQGGVAGRAAAVTAHQAQAVLAYEPDVSLLTEAGYPEIMVANDIPLLRDASSFAWVVKSEWAKANKEVVVRLMKAWMEAANAVYDPAKKSAVVAALASQMKIDPKIAATAHDHWAVKRSVWSRTCKVNLPEVDAVTKQLLSQKLIDPPGPKAADVVLDPSQCAEALK